MNKNKLIVVLVGMLDVMGIGFVIPTLPDLVKLYGVSDHLISYGITVYALSAFLAGPLLGQLSDIYGRKKILLLCVVGSFLSSIVIATTPFYIYFLLGRLINGITGGNISILQAILSDISKTPQERKINMGIIGTIFGVGFIVGPLMGGILLHFGPLVPYWGMVALCFIEILVIIFSYKETNENMIQKKIKFNPFGRMLKYIRKKEISHYISSMFLILCSFAVYQGVLPLYLNKHYNFSGTQSGYLLAGFGITMVLNQIFVLRQFWLKYFSLNQLLYIINISLVIFFILITFTNNLVLFLIFFFILICIQTVVAPVYNGEIIEHTDIHSRGEIMGVLSSFQSLSMFVGPLMGGYLLALNLSIFSCSAILIIISLIIIVNKIKNNNSLDEVS